MRLIRKLALASITLVSLSTAALASPAAAAPEPEPISVRVTNVTLGGDPRLPSGTSTVTLTNDSKVAERAAFVFGLREGLTLGPSAECEPTAAQGAGLLWKCGSWDLEPGESTSVIVPVVTARQNFTFGVTKLVGWARGESIDGRTGLPQDFTATYPAKTQLRLEVTRDPLVPTTARVRVTNAGSFALAGGYAMEVRSSRGLRVTSTACVTRPDDTAACEVYRGGTLAVGATDSFPLHFATDSGPVGAEFNLIPAPRYTNTDTHALLTIG